MRNFVLLLLAISLPVLATTKDADERLSLAVIDISTQAFPDIDPRSLNDIFRTELFKTKLFDLVERGEVLKAIMSQKVINDKLVEADLAKIGQALAVQKILTAHFFQIEGQAVLNCNIIDVNSQKIEYTENIYSKIGTGLLQPCRELVEKITLYYKTERMSDAKHMDAAGKAAQWSLLGASQDEIKIIEGKSGTLKQFYQIRQYDIRFTPSAYADLLESQSNFEILETFLKAGIRFDEYKKSMRLGIYSLAAYQDNFLPDNISFADYLTAYENQIYSGPEFKRFKKSNSSGRILVGAGCIVDKFPIADAAFAKGVIRIGYEHYFMNVRRGPIKWSPEVGLNLLNWYLPTPYACANFYLGKYPFYGKVGLGAYYEFVLGGHAAMFLNLGCELNQIIEVSYMLIPFGSQPRRSYNAYNGEYLKKDDPNFSKVDIDFPYMGVFLNWKIPTMFDKH
jgi:hypothetical protein